MPAASYLVGRQQADLRSKLDESDISDLLFAAQRLDGTGIKELSFEHCTFANVSFKDCIFDRAKFRDCVFVDCYFRGTRVQNTSFSTCKFIDCDFTKLDMRTSELKWYNHFKGCWIRRHDVEDNLPSEPNLRHHLCMNLYTEARAAGALKESEWFRQIAAEANELHLSSAFRQKTQYYAEKFKGRLAIGAFLEYCASRLRGYLWGYRRSFLVGASHEFQKAIMLLNELVAESRHLAQRSESLDARWREGWSRLRTRLVELRRLLVDNAT